MHVRTWGYANLGMYHRLNDMATRVVASWYQLQQDNTTLWPEPPKGEDARPNFSSFTNKRKGLLHPSTDDKQEVIVNKYVDVQGFGKPGKDHTILAQEIAAEGHVLVKNTGNLLPINQHGLSGSSQPDPNKKMKVGIFGEDAGPVNDPKWPNQCEDRACNEGTLAVGWGSGAAEFPFLIDPAQALEKAFNTSTVEVSTSLSNKPHDVPKDLSNMEICFAFVNSDAGEGFKSWNGISDRKDLSIQKGGNDLIGAVSKTCKNTVVVIHTVGPVIVEKWADKPNVKAIIFANLPGEKSGYGFTDVLFGLRDATGRLPYTVGKSLDDFGPGAQVMYKPKPKTAPQQSFKEGLFIDYRYFDRDQIAPRYPFGFGLSYTIWSLTNLEIVSLKAASPLPSPRPSDPEILPPSYQTELPDISTTFFPADFRKLKKYIYPYLTPSIPIVRSPYPYPKGYSTPNLPSQAGGGQGGNPSLYDNHINITVSIKNTGSRTGKQVLQLYLTFPPNIRDEITNEKIETPVRVLRAFEKVQCQPGEEKSVSMTLDRRALSFWSRGRQNWVMPAGTFGVQVGFSSRDLILNGTWDGQAAT